TPPIHICDPIGGCPPYWAGTPPNQSKSFIPPAWRSSRPETTRRRNSVTCLARSMVIEDSSIDDPADSTWCGALEELRRGGGEVAGREGWVPAAIWAGAACDG